MTFLILKMGPVKVDGHRAAGAASGRRSEGHNFVGCHMAGLMQPLSLSRSFALHRSGTDASSKLDARGCAFRYTFGSAWSWPMV